MICNNIKDNQQAVSIEMMKTLAKLKYHNSKT